MFYQPYERQSPQPDPEVVAYFSRINREAREEAIRTQRYVSVRYGEDAPNCKGCLGLTYDPEGKNILPGSSSPEGTAATLRLVALANAALDARLCAEVAP